MMQKLYKTVNILQRGADQIRNFPTQYLYLFNMSAHKSLETSEQISLTVSFLNTNNICHLIKY